MNRPVAAKRHLTPFGFALLAACFLIVAPRAAHADVHQTGDVGVSIYNDIYTFCVGNSSGGTLSITNGSSFNAGYYPSYIGYNPGATGVVTVDGAGSTWTIPSGATGVLPSVTVGYYGSGTLSITNGGAVNSTYDNTVGYGSNSTGVVSVDGGGSTWTTSANLNVGVNGGGTLSISNHGGVSAAGATYVGAGAGSAGMIQFADGTLTTQTLFASPTQLMGTGSINAHGLVSDIDLLFDSTQSLVQTIAVQRPGQNIEVNLDMASSTSTNGALGAGWIGTGSLTIKNGVTVSSNSGYFGYQRGATGLATVTGSSSTWTCRNNLYVGYSGNGTLAISNGGSVGSGYSFIGYAPGSTGAATVDGPGSSFTCYNLYVGNSGSGTLSISNGGNVSVASEAFVGMYAGSAGVIQFGPNGGTLTTPSLLASPSQLAGTGTINARGLVSDTNLVFDSTHGPTQTLSFQQPGQNVVINLDMGSAPVTNGDLGAGWKGSGSLTIRDAVAVTSSTGYVGYTSGSTGTVAVVGAGSTWISSVMYTQFWGGLYVGNSGSGTLSISNGGSVSSPVAFIGYAPGSLGAVTVDGSGSTWSNTAASYNGNRITVGGSGSGTLQITNGGTVTNGATSSYGCTIGDALGSAGVVRVDGAGSVWNTGALTVGNSGSGTLSTAHGGAVNCNRSGVGVIGNAPGSTGVVTVDAAGLTWTAASSTVVGNSGSGTLSIINGGSVTSAIGYLGYAPGSTGVATVDGAGSTWNYSSWFYVGNSGSGRLSITNGAHVVGGSNTSTIGGKNGATGVVTVDGSGSSWTTTASTPVGSIAVISGGTLSVTNGGSISSNGGGAVGASGATGVVTVDGAHSMWTDSGSLTDYGGGILSITNGGGLSSAGGYIGNASSSLAGVFHVDGTGSFWTNSGNINVGNVGTATLSLTGGGAVTTTSLSIYSNRSLLAIDVGRGSLLAIGGGTGTISNNGVIRILAGAGVPAGSGKYSPISAKTWSGSGTYQAIGGTWDKVGHTFTASSVTTGTSNSAVALDLASVQRALIDDGVSSWEVGASFPAAASTTNMTFTATAMNNTLLEILRSELPANDAILSGWSFSTTGFTVSSSNPVYLSFQVGAGHPAETLQVWHYDDSRWAGYPALDLSCDGNYASFTVSGFSGYAMVAVAEPGTMALFTAGLLSLLAFARRRRKRRA